jgi:serine phosphatase RsbU (regulator of sigma subunit)
MKPTPQPESEPRGTSLKSLTEELLAVYEELTLLYSLGTKLGRLTDESQIASTALQEAMDVLGADCGWVVLWDEGNPQVLDVCCLRQIEPSTVECVNWAVLEPLRCLGKTQVLLNSLTEEYQLPQSDAPARLLASCLPVGKISRGYLCLGRHQTGRIFTAADQKLINAVAILTAMELENIRLQRSELEKQRLESELELARNIQRSLLPRDFSCNDFLDAMGVSEPCFEIGGDYFDLIRTGTDSCLMVIADVAGKGPPAALQAAMVQGIVHGVSRHSQDLSCLMGTLNQCILTRAAGRYVTAFLATLDRAGGLRYSNAGHNPPLWIRKDGSVTELTEAGLLLGFQETIYLEGFIQLVPGDLLLLYTDGVTDSVNERDETFGLIRLLRWAGQQVGKSPAEVKESLIHTVGQFCGKSRQADDLAVLVVQYRKPSGLGMIAI